LDVLQETPVAYIICEPCVGIKDSACVDVCPVDCFYEGANMLVIHPDECIDCGVCEPECPPKAIVPDSDAQGRYRLETIIPAEYPGRARHIHVKVQAPGRRVLTTQLYFPNQPGNRRDGIYRAELEMKIAKPGEGAFDFVVDA